MSKVIPTYLFDEHNEAYYFWHRAHHEGYFNKALDIFHVDAHNDMAKLQKLQNSLYWKEADDDDYLARYHKIAYREMSIANFIIPAVLNNLVRNIYFIYPGWRKFARKQTRTNVATAFGEGNVLKHGINVPDSEKTKLEFTYPDLTEYGYVMTDVERIPGNRNVILDIDLDYFACTDSITNRMSFELLITADQYQNREKFIDENPALRYSSLEIGFEKRAEAFVATVQFKKLDDKEHLPTESEIKREVDKLCQTLVDKSIQPAVITICRSCISGYCPPDYFQMIEDYVLQKLQSWYPAISVSS